MTTKIYVDGACSGNPGKGAWCAIVVENDRALNVLSGFDSYTTNQRMELLAAISGLQAVIGEAEVYTDSRYVYKGITDWITDWKNTSWKNGKVKNQDLWKQLDFLNSTSITWKWLKGHAGDKYNEMANDVAQSLCSGNE